MLTRYYKDTRYYKKIQDTINKKINLFTKKKKKTKCYKIYIILTLNIVNIL